MRLAALAALAAVVAAASALATRALADDGWAWVKSESTGHAEFGRRSGTPALEVDASTLAAQFSAGRSIHLTNTGANFEFEHGTGTKNSLLLPHAGGNPTSLVIGRDDGQNLTPLQVWVNAARPADLQRWTVGGEETAAITGSGKLRLGSVTLSIRAGKLVATLPDGSQQTLHPVSAGRS